MDTQSLHTLARLIRGERTAALATLRKGDPLVSMVPFVPSDDFTAYYIHISRLAYHTQDILKDARVSLMIAERDMGQKDPQLLARVSFRGSAVMVSSDEVEAVRARYLQRFPEALRNFGLGDFALYQIRPTAVRYVAGFGKIFNLRLDDLTAAAAVDLTA